MTVLSRDSFFVFKIFLLVAMCDIYTLVHVGIKTKFPAPLEMLDFPCFANPASKAQRAHSVHPLRWLVGEIPKPLGAKPYGFCT